MLLLLLPWLPPGLLAPGVHLQKNVRFAFAWDPGRIPTRVPGYPGIAKTWNVPRVLIGEPTVPCSSTGGSNNTSTSRIILNNDNNVQFRLGQLSSASDSPGLASNLTPILPGYPGYPGTRVLALKSSKPLYQKRYRDIQY
eukprot:2634757-Rhodomonas_salina.1